MQHLGENIIDEGYDENGHYIIIENPVTGEERTEYLPDDAEEGDYDFDDEDEKEDLDEPEEEPEKLEDNGERNRPGDETPEPLEGEAEAAELGPEAAELAAETGAEVAEAGGAGGAAAGGAAGGAAAAGAVEGGVVAAESNPAGWGITIGCLIFVVIVIAVLILTYFYYGLKDSEATTTCGKTVIVLDPGHPSEVGVGGSGNGVDEVDKVLEIAKTLKPKLEAKGYTVVLTRNNNTRVTNKERAEIANDKNANIFFRIHNDDGGRGRGFAYYYPSKQGTVNGTTGPPNDVIKKSKTAAKTILGKSESIITVAGMPPYNGGLLTDADTQNGKDNGGALTGSIYSNVPTVLVEVGDLDNKTDANWLKSKSNIDKLTDGFTEGIIAAVGGTPGEENCSTALSADRAIALAMKQVGKPYVWGTPSRNWASNKPPGDTPHTFDCSGLVGWSYYWGTDGKVNMNGQTETDYKDSSVVTHIKENELQPGDLIYFSGTESPGGIEHVAIFLGGKKYVHAAGRATGVKVSDNYTNDSRKKFFARVKENK